jgi:hypothetical protein
MDIDFVVLWVDGNDPAWIAEFSKYAPKKKDISIDIVTERYRDSGLLRYWFRGIEKNTPWIRKIFFVTNGQKPEWLNVNNEKLCWVKHDEYIPHEYLPSFNSNAIQIYLHNIKGLSENFVLFDDDMYILNPVGKDYFFKKGLPRDYAILRPIKIPDFFSHTTINNMLEINNYFGKYEAIRRNFSKFFNFRYSPKYFLPAYYISHTNSFPGFYYKHFAQPYLKKTFEEVWTRCGETLIATAQNRFRSIADVTHYLFRYWQLVKGEFFPETPNKQRKLLKVAAKNTNQIKETIGNRHIKELCLNDTDCPDECYVRLTDFFEKKFPHKSSFEL